MCPIGADDEVVIGVLAEVAGSPLHSERPCLFLGVRFHPSELHSVFAQGRPVVAIPASHVTSLRSCWAAH
jgi:hypothetical protein